MPSPPNQTREIPVQTRAMSVATVDEQARTFEMVWSTGAAVTRMDWWTGKRYVEELDMDPSSIRMDRLNGGAPLLNTHGSYDLSDVIGVVEKAWIENGEGRALVRFSDREDVQGIWRDVVGGIIRNVSVGYAVHRYEITKEDASNIETWRAMDWEPMEVSLVPVPADAGAGVRSQENTARLVRCEIVNLSNHEDRAMPNETQERSADGQVQTQAQQDTGTEAQIRAATDAALTAERKRIAEIKEAVRASQLGDDLADEFVQRGISADECRREVLRRLSERTAAQAIPGGRIEMGADERQRAAQGIALSLEVRSGMAQDADQVGNEYRGMTLMEMAKECLRLQGVSMRGMGKVELAALALPTGARIGNGIISRSTLGQTSTDFANILANVAYKSMMRGYGEAEETFQRWTNTGILSDFKPVKRVDLNEFPALSKIDEGGEYTMGTVGDRGETVQLATYGKKFSITRQAIINDDLSAFTRVPTKMGRAAIRTVGNLVYAVLTGNPTMSDGIALFHASHNNLMSSAIPSTASVDAMRAAMMKQKDASGNVVALNIPLRFLIVPVALGGLARQVMNSEFEVGASNKNNTTPNYVRGLCEVIDDARLDVASTTVWYGSASPAAFDTVEVSYLDGNTTPYMEQQNGWDVDGVEFKVRIDAGVKALDFRTLAKSP